MAKAKEGISNAISAKQAQRRKSKRTSIGSSKNSRPKHKQFGRNKGRRNG